MSELDQQPEGRRQRRFLGRVLIVVGATVAGTTGLWPVSDTAMAGTSAEAPRPPLVESTSVVGGDLVPDLAAERLPAPGELRGVPDAAHSEEPAPRFVDAGPLGGYPASETARPGRLLPTPGSAPMFADVGVAVHEHAPESGAAAAIAGSERIRQPRPAVRSGAGGRGTAPRHVLTTAPVSPGAIPGVVDPPHVDDTPIVQPGPAANTAPHGPALPSAGDRALSTADENAENPGARREPARNAPSRPGHPFVLADAGLNGCACSIDWAGHGAVAHPRKAGPGSRDGTTPVGHTSSPAAVVAVSDAQPGTTPD
ncbi:hypothetical protein [Parasphingorhabdus pacifica]